MKLKVGYRELIEQAETEIKCLTVPDAVDLAQKEKVEFIDIRDIRETKKEGEIPGSVHAPRGMLEFWVDPESPYHRKLFSAEKIFIFYCTLGWRSALATKTVQDMGMQKVCHLVGGFKEWRRSGHPIQKRSK